MLSRAYQSLRAWESLFIFACTSKVEIPKPLGLVSCAVSFLEFVSITLSHVDHLLDCIDKASKKCTFAPIFDNRKF